MKQIKNWAAKRSGAFIVISGKDAKGADIKIHATEIKAGVNYPCATDREGAKFALLPNVPK